MGGMGWRTWLARLGIRTLTPLGRIAPRLDVPAALGVFEPDGAPETFLFEDVVHVLHADGGRARRYHCLVHVADPRLLDGWEHHTYSVPVRKGRIKTLCARHRPPGSSWIRARQRRYQAYEGATLADVLHLEFRGLVPGSLLEVAVHFEWYGPGPWGRNLFDEFYFVTTAPARHRRFVLAVPADREVAITERNGPPAPRTHRAGGLLCRTWEARDIEGYLSDALSPAPRDDVACVEVSTCEDWSPIVERYREQLAVGAVQRALPPEIPIAEPASDPVGRAKELFAFVSGQVRYGRPHEAVASLSARAPGVTANELRGDCKDKVSLLSSLLEPEGWSTDFVLVETQTATLAPFLPAPRFDHVLLRARRDGRTLWLEPTPGYEDFDYVPAHLQGNPGLSLAAENRALEALPILPLERNEHHLRYRGVLDPDGNLRLTHDETLTGTYASERREFLAQVPEVRWEEVLGRARAADVPGAVLEGLTVADREALDRPVRHTMVEVLPRWAREAGRYRIIRLPWTYVGNAAIVGAAGRSSGLLLGNRRREWEELVLELPAGWTLAGGEIQRALRSPWLDYTLEVGVRDGRIVAERRCEFVERVVRPQDYAEFKRFYEDLARADRHDLVLGVG